MDKNELRKRFRRLPVSQDASRFVCSCLLEDSAVQNASQLLLYWPLPDEIDITPLFELDKELALPKVDMAAHTMDFYPFTGELRKGALGVMEPSSDCPVRLRPDALMIVPALAYSLSGVRLGRGMAYYDGYLRGRNIRTIGVISSERILPAIPADRHDVRIERIFCEKGEVSLA